MQVVCLGGIPGGRSDGVRGGSRDGRQSHRHDVLVSGLSLWTTGLEFVSGNCPSRGGGGWDVYPSVSETHQPRVVSRTINTCALPGYTARGAARSPEDGQGPGARGRKLQGASGMWDPAPETHTHTHTHTQPLTTVAAAVGQATAGTLGKQQICHIADTRQARSHACAKSEL